MPTISAIPSIILFCYYQMHTVIFISFHVPCIILSNVHFNILVSMFLFLFNQSQSEAGVVNQTISPCFGKRSTVCQSNVQAAKTEQKNCYTIRNIMYITF